MSTCQGCGAEKDPNELEVYPYPEDGRLTDESMEPLITLECQDEIRYQPFRIVVVCHECFHKLDPDMWIGRKCWESLNPVVPFEALPTKDEV